MLLVALLGCEPADAPHAPDEPHAPGAGAQTARSAPTSTAPWSGAWTIQVLAADPAAAGPAALSAATGKAAARWDGAHPAPRPGTAALIWLPVGTDVAQLPPAQGVQGDVVAILAPGDAAWAEAAAEALPWAGFSVVDPALSARPWAASLDDSLAGYVAAWVVAEHYERCVDGACLQPVTAALPPGLDVLLGPWNPAFLGAPDVRTRAEAARRDPSSSLNDTVAVRLGVATSTADPALLARLAVDPEPLVRARAADRLDDAALLATLANDPSSVVRVVATDRLARIGAAEPLRAAARSPDAYQRWKAAWGLGKIPGSTDALLPLLTDPDIDVRREAARSLGRQRDPAAVEPLIVALKDPNSFVRRWAAVGLGEARDPRALDALLEASRDPTALVAQAAARALANLGRNVPAPPFHPPGKPKDDAAIDALTADPDATVRKDVCKFLVGRADAGRWLERLASDADSEVRKSAVEAMGWHPETAPSAAAHLQDVDPDTVVTALDALRRAGAGRADQITPLLTHPDAEVRLRATEALAALGPSPALEALRDTPDERARAAVIAVYPQHLAPGEPSVLVRRAAGRADPDPLADPAFAAWSDGILSREDDLLHLRFSWNEPEDRPTAHRALRPPVVRTYGHPDRG